MFLRAFYYLPKLSKYFKPKN